MNSKVMHNTPTCGRLVYHLAAADLDGKGKRTLITASLDGRITAFGTDDQILWDAKTAGFPFDLCAYDIDGDGVDEILVASGDHHLYAIDGQGKVLWRFETQAPVCQITAGKLDGKTPLVFAGGIDRHL